MVAVSTKPQFDLYQQTDDSNNTVSEKTANTITVDGITVDKNDLFGINSKREEALKAMKEQADAQKEGVIKDIDEQIDSHKKWLSHWQEGQQNGVELFHVALDGVNNFTEQYNKLLSRAGKKFEDLQGNQLKLAKEFLGKIKDFRSMRISAGADISSYGNMASTENGYLNNCQNQKILAERMLNK